MSTDWYLYSPSHKRKAMCGSVGLSGVQSFPAHPEVIDFIRWAIDETVTDIIMLDEHRLSVMEETE